MSLMALIVQLDGIFVYGSNLLSSPFFSSPTQINWQERCLELQLELHRSKTQAGRFQNRLREKVSNVRWDRLSHPVWEGGRDIDNGASERLPWAIIFYLFDVPRCG